MAAFVRCRSRAVSSATRPDRTPKDQGPASLRQIIVLDAAGEPVRLRIPPDQQSRDTLLRNIYAAWCNGEIDTIGALETVIERNAPGMEKPARTIAVNSLIYDDAPALRVLEPDSAPRGSRRLQGFDGQPENEWIRHGHIAWLAFVIYRLRAGTHLAEQLLDTLFDDPDAGRTLLAEAQTLAHRRRTQTPNRQGLHTDSTDESKLRSSLIGEVTSRPEGSVLSPGHGRDAQDGRPGIGRR